MKSKKHQRYYVSAFFAFVITVLAPFVARAATINVPGDAATIQAAINAAANGDTIIVADGTYNEYDISFHGKAITVKSVNGPAACIIDCNGSGRGFKFDSSAESGVVLNGFTVINGSERKGGAIYCKYASPTIKNFVIKNNTASDDGGGIYGENASPIIENCIVANNDGHDNGGGMYFNHHSAPTIRNCTVVYNEAHSDGKQIYCADSPGIIINTIVWGDYGDKELHTSGDAPTVSYSDVLLKDGHIYSGDGNINQDPLFSFEVSLSALSPCIDAGTAVNAPATDIVGTPRPQGSGIDMGAYEYVADSDSDGLLDEWEYTHFGTLAQEAEDDPDNDGVTNLDEYNANPQTCPSCGDNLTVYADDWTIQAAMDQVNDNGTVMVQDGTYTGQGNKDLDFNGRAITVASVNGPTNCIIDCANAGRGITFDAGETLSSVISGLTIKNGLADYGAGIACFSSSPTIQNCIIKNNATSNHHTTSNHHKRDGDGGGIYCDDASPLIENCLITDNVADDKGGGVYCKKDSEPTIRNCTITQNTPAGEQINCDSPSVTIVNAIIWGDAGDNAINRNDLNVSCSDIRLTSGVYAGTGNINADPLFDADFRLQTGSPCFNAGTDSGVSVKDLFGAPRTLLGRTDMGAYEFYEPEDASSLVFIPDTLDDIWELENFGTLAQEPDDDPDNDGVTNLDEYNAQTCPRCGSDFIVEVDDWLIQDAINRVDAGGTITIGDGTYTGLYNRNLDFSGKAITVTSANGAISCIIDCKSKGRGVSFKNGETATSILSGVTIANGLAENGGGIYCDGASPSIFNCVLKDNSTSTGNGGSVYCHNAAAQITNCTIMETRQAYTTGGLVYTNNSANPAVFSNSIFYNAVRHSCETVDSTNVSPTVNYCLVSGGSYGGTGNINDLPLLTDDGHLLWGSPCIDAGMPSGFPTVDFEGDPRATCFTSDIGADEYFVVGDGDCDYLPDNWESAYSGDFSTNGDDDGDGMLNIWEYLLGYNPTVNDMNLATTVDADGDGFSDYVELRWDANPLTGLLRPVPSSDYQGTIGVYYEYDALGRIKSITRLK